MKRGEADVIVIGGGAIGLCAAAELAGAGLRTILLERGRVGSEQSVRTGGGVRSQFGSRTSIELSVLSAPFWDRFEHRTGIDPFFRRIGYLFMARSAAVSARLSDQVRLQNECGVDSEYLDGGEIVRRWPHLGDHGYVAASFRANDGHVSRFRAVEGFARAAVRAGAAIVTGVEVLSVERAAGAIAGVETTEGFFAAPLIVNAAGAQAARIAAMAGQPLPLSNRRHELLIVRPEARPVPEDLPWHIDIEGEVHMRPDGDGRALVGGFLGKDEEISEKALDLRAEPAWVKEVLPALQRAFGLLDDGAGKVKIMHGWAGLYPCMPDGHPVIDRPEDGYIVAAGFAGTGLMHAPAAGILVAELARLGRINAIDGVPLAQARFFAKDKLERTGF